MQNQQLNQKLDKVVFPVSKIQLKYELQGIFAPPDQWKTIDQANPNLFTYTSKFIKFQLLGGKLTPRQFTEKQIRQQQEEAAKKKGGKKQSKQNANQQQKLRKIKEQEAEQQKRKLEQWQKLTDEQKFYATSQDPYKTFSIKFQKKTHTLELVGNTLVIFQQRVIHDKGEWIYFYKYPSITQDQIAKLKKGKSKTLNPNDLNPITMRAWVDFSKLSLANTTEIRVRCSLSQIQQQADTPKPNLQKTYALVKINLSQAIVKQSDVQQLNSNEMIKAPPGQAIVPLDIQSVNQLKKQIRLALQSIGMEYSVMFWKQLNFFQQQKNINSLATVKKSDLLKRKEQFLYDFNMTGKYKILKQRIKKVIVNVCKHKYANVLSQYTSFTGISTESKDQFYSQIYNFLVTTTQQTLLELINKKTEQLNQTIVPSYNEKVNQVFQYIKLRIQQQSFQKVVRLSNQCQQLRQIQSAQDIYTKNIQKQPKNLKLKFQFAKFSLRNKIGNPFPSKIIALIYQCLRYERNSKQLKLIYLILLMSTKKKSELKQSWIILRQLISEDKNNIQYYLLASYLFSLLNQQTTADKFQKISQRMTLRRNGTLPQKGNHKKSPIVSQIPNFKNVCQYNISLKANQKDQLWLILIKMFSNYNIYTLVQGLLNKLSNKQQQQLLVLAIKIQLFKGNNKLALQKALQLASKSPSYQLLQLITTISFTSKNYQIAEQYLKKTFKFKQAANNHTIYLRLGYVYHQFKKFANAKACLVKALSLAPNHSLAWFKLGSAQLQLGGHNQSLNCFREANILNHENSQIWLKLCQNYIKLGKYNIANQCLVNHLKIESQNNKMSKRKYKIGQLQFVKDLLKETINGKNENDNLLIKKMYRSIELTQQ